MAKTRTRSILIVVSALLLSASMGARAEAGQLSQEQEDLAVLAGLEAVAKAGLRSVPLDQIEVTRLPDGLTKVAIPLPEGVDFEEVFHAEKSGQDELATRPFLLALTVDLFRPNLHADTVEYDCAPLVSSDYNYGWVVMNLSSSERVLKTKAIVSGPGGRMTASGRLLYDAHSMVLFYFEGEALGVPGIYTYSVKVSGAGSKLKGRLCAGC
jgi:hypothetical protein